ncbi:MAG: TRAP transporter substrate-binding protein DctP [Pseudochelatococcus sp.]|jgi:TRAP-type C4-dicarboxylate transport system substrate-binding protein|uniref:TRAP transporter substrate-binding protein DctP n=1 Tax=Pseudochelatococcus sp. TaxID=2020869 RepID=UPI003D8A16AF
MHRMSAPLFGVILAVASVSTARAETVTYGAYLSPSNPVITGGLEPLRAQIAESTGGGLVIEPQIGGSIVKERTTLEGIESGVVSAGYVVDAYLPSELPHSTLINDLGMGPADIRAGSLAVTEFQLLGCPGCAGDLKRAGVNSLAIHRISDYYLLCRQGITSSAQLSGKRIKATGNWSMIATNVGASVVNVPASDMYEAFQRGLIDCAIAPHYWLRTMSLWDSIKVVFDLPLGAFQGGHMMTVSSEVWEDLGDRHRAAVLDAMPDMILGVSNEFLSIEADVRREAAEHGVSYVPADDGLVSAFEKAREEAVRNAIDRARRARVADPEALVSGFRDTLAKWEKILDETGEDRAALAARARSEIYDRIRR